MSAEQTPQKPPPAVSELTDVHCPVCKTGLMGSIMGRYGLYWTCNSTATPKCKFNLSSKPTGRFCSFKRGATAGAVCGALMVEGTKTIPERCSDKSCANRNPHKL